MANVLIADDEPWFLKSFQRMLEHDGHEVLMASTAVDALAMLQRLYQGSSHENSSINLLFVDMMMPYYSLEDIVAKAAKGGQQALHDILDKDITTGLQLVKDIKFLYPDIRIIILSILSKEEIWQFAGGHDPGVEVIDKRNLVDNYDRILNYLS